jgi:epoxide hydrolase-like predicted phosphatase
MHRTANEPIQGIIFDFGGVFTKTAQRAKIFRQCEAQLGLAESEMASILFTGAHWWDLSTGKTSADEYWQHVAHALGGKIPGVLEPFNHNPFAYEALNERMVGLGRQLHKHFCTALLSNATIYLDTLLAEHNLISLFDIVVNSARVGLRKPDPAIFELTLDSMSLAPAQCLFIDDKERNTKAADALGLQTIVFRSAAQLKRQLAERCMLPH